MHVYTHTYVYTYFGTVVPLLRDHPLRPVKGGLWQGGSWYGVYYIGDLQSRSYKEMVFHEGGLSKGVQL